LFDNDEAAKTWLFSADRTGTAHAGTGRADIITARSAPDRSASSMTGFRTLASYRRTWSRTPRMQGAWYCGRSDR
jgi:hypothetical protein